MFRAIERARVSANFFFVGDTVREHRGLVREIASAHAADTHTDTHPNLRRLTKEQQRDQIRRGRGVLEDLLGSPVLGFRAPYHHLNQDTVDVLNEERFRFDASMLYFRYNPGNLQEVYPTWFREWMPLYGQLGLSPETTFGVFRTLVRLRNTCVLPAHPQYSGRDAALARGFENFLHWSVDQGARFWRIQDWLLARRGVAVAPLPVAGGGGGLPQQESSAVVSG
jgi:peptidoglycan/xylan/chitin deacetylase (PgdA/CDA1 family)